MASFQTGPDPEGLREYSVVFTDRALNHMSAAFQQVMRDLSQMLRETYTAEAAVLVPGGGTAAMESVARQLAPGQRCLVVRNGWFSYRWSQILEMGGLGAATTVRKAAPLEPSPQAAWAPPPVREVAEAIAESGIELVFAPHVETSAGMLLPDPYLRELAEAVHANDGLMVLDCVASGALWVDMAALGVDVLISAPQKSWSATPSTGLVMLSPAALARVEATQSSSFALDLKQWLGIMRAYEGGGHAYHATLPTDGLRHFRDAMLETRAFGLERARERQLALGRRVRGSLAARGFASVAAEGFAAPGVVVCHTRIDAIHSGAAFAERGIQIAKGVPLMCGEDESFKTFRIGLFGLDKLGDVDGTVAHLEAALDTIAASG